MLTDILFLQWMVVDQNKRKKKEAKFIHVCLLVYRVTLVSLTIWCHDAYFKILAMRHPRRLVLSGCLSALIVRKISSLYLVYCCFFCFKFKINCYYVIRIISWVSKLLGNFQILGDDHSICCCRLGCSKFGKTSLVLLKHFFGAIETYQFSSLCIDYLLRYPGET